MAVSIIPSHAPLHPDLGFRYTHLTKAMAIELAPHRIRVNSVGPTLVDTPLARRVVDTPEKRAYFESRIPLGALASIEDIVAAAVYLASPAAAMVTGAHLLVDGGWTAQ